MSDQFPSHARVVIVGGGSWAWVLPIILARRLGRRNGSVREGRIDQRQHVARGGPDHPFYQ